MFLMLSRILSRTNCILILVILNHASSAPVQSRKNSPLQNEQGFSTFPKIVEFQLPLKIASKEDLVAWSKYVSNLMATKVNLTPIMKNSPTAEKRLPFMNDLGSKSKEMMMKKAPVNEKRQGPPNYPARRLKEPPMQRPDDKVVAFPLPIGAMQTTTPKPQDHSSFSTSSINGQTDFGQYVDFNVGNFFQQSEIDTFGNFDAFLQPPANAYLPVPPRQTDDTAKSNQNAVGKNSFNSNKSTKLQNTMNPSNPRVKTQNDELGAQMLPFSVNNGLTEVNMSRIGEPLLTFPFQAMVTITKELPAATMLQLQDYTDLPDEFLPFFENNYRPMNESGHVFNDFITDTSETKTQGNVKKAENKKKSQNVREQKKQSQKANARKTNAKTSAKSQKSSVKQQSAVLGDLLRMLGILRKLTKNSTEINVATPVLSILKGTNTQKIQVALEEALPNRKRNQIFLAQQMNEDNDKNDNDGVRDTENDDIENSGNGNSNNENSDNENADNEDIDNGNNDDEGPQTEAQEDDEEGGGSIQAILDLLPLAAPILEDLSDPNSDVDIVELLEGALPLLEGLSDPEEDGFDIPGVLLPLSQRLSEGPEGQGSDSGSILGPIVQLIAPLSGPLSGPLIAPLSRTSSGPDGIQGSASVFGASAEPLSKPTGPYGQSVLSGLVAGITAKLSKESALAAGDSDVKSLVSSIVQGVLAGASAGSQQKKGYGYGYGTPYGYGARNNSNVNRYGNNDPYHTSTTYDHYQAYPDYSYKPTKSVLTEPIQTILGAFLKLSATSSTSSASLSGTSSEGSSKQSASASSKTSQETPTYGPPTHATYPHTYHPTYVAAPKPSYAASPPASSSYTSYTQRRTRQQKKM
ncbi:uncharacterized protein LOC105201019 [Solenopsis invicta]|uniref:uncharacterized protein LOC105201019 n=1 Tax=Solenopsis invicta TaxID=13686 RepID=UPI000595E780|nr:uncharacterized protein LOC105201019 [Solenopsis invicta]